MPALRPIIPITEDQIVEMSPSSNSLRAAFAHLDMDNKSPATLKAVPTLPPVTIASRRPSDEDIADSTGICMLVFPGCY